MMAKGARRLSALANDDDEYAFFELIVAPATVDCHLQNNHNPILWHKLLFIEYVSMNKNM